MRTYFMDAPLRERLVELEHLLQALHVYLRHLARWTRHASPGTLEFMFLSIF